MFQKIIYLFLLVIIGQQAIAQGLLMDEDSDERYEQLPRLPDLNDGGKAENKALEGITEWSLKAYCPQPKYQGTASTCVGWAVGYAALTIQRAIANEWKGQTDLITENAFSPMFIYNQIKLSDCQAGAHVDAAMQLLRNKGDVLATRFDKSLSDCSIMPTAADFIEAANHKILDFATLFSHKANRTTKINRIKLSLIQNRPVVVGMRLLNNFQQLKRGAATYWQPTKGDTKRYGGHALVVVGFDDSRGAFEVMNSWGTEWGNGGFIWVKYEDFAKFCQYGFQMSLRLDTPLDKRYAGQFQLRRFEALRANGEPLFSEEPVELSNGTYQLAKSSITKNTIFQFLVQQVTTNTYLYAFGIESDGTLKNYWPQTQESALLAVPAMELYLPGPDAGLQFTKSGTEHIILLYANRPILDIESRKAALPTAQGQTVLEKLRTVFGADLLSTHQINYVAQTMQFVSPLAQGHIIPLVLTVEVE
ncbi:MAG: C1 family peptidase [Bacteroidota bacterium]